MNNKQKIIVIVAAVLIIAALIVWLSNGGEVFTKTHSSLSSISKMIFSARLIKSGRTNSLSVSITPVDFQELFLLLAVHCSSFLERIKNNFYKTQLLKIVEIK